LLLLSSLTSLVGLGQAAITDSDEAYYAEAAREMVVGGDWLTPHFNFRDRWEKPVLYYWLTASTYLVTGPTEYAARLWSALAGIGLTFLTWSMARHAGATPSGAWLAGAIVATTFGCVSMARSALPDLPLAACITATMWAMLHAVDAGTSRPWWWIVAGAAAGLGFLMKGPIAIVVAGVALVPIWWRERATLHISPQHVGLAALVALAVGLPWYAAMTATHGWPYLQSFFVADNFERFATARYNEPRPFWFYAPVVLGGLLPWTAYLVTLPATRVGERGPGARFLTRWEWRLSLWALMPLLFFSASVGQQPRYVLPVLPPLAVLLACGITSRTEPGARAETGRVRIGTWITAFVLLTCAALLVRLQPLFEPPPAVFWSVVVATGACAAGLAWIAAAGRWSLLPVALAVSAAVLQTSVMVVALAGGRPAAVEQMAAMVRVHRTGSERLAPYRVFARNLVFYTGMPQVELFDDAQARTFLESRDRVLMVVQPADLARLSVGLATSPRTLGQVDYVNTADIRLRTILAPDPTTLRQRVLLVANR
jgi:4-amino-4-deoxy-L-arabinose transferase-like glycosyltransferase